MTSSLTNVMMETLETVTVVMTHALWSLAGLVQEDQELVQTLVLRYVVMATISESMVVMMATSTMVMVVTNIASSNMVTSVTMEFQSIVILHGDRISMITTSLMMVTF